MNGISRALVLVAVALSVAVLSAGVASADGPVQLRSGIGDFCLDAPNGGWFTPVVINPCTDAASQRWNVNGDGYESVAFAGECLTKMYARLVVYIQPCSNWPSQRFTSEPNNQITNGYGGCLAILGGPGAGAEVTIGFCIPDGLYQEWDRVP